MAHTALHETAVAGFRRRLRTLLALAYSLKLCFAWTMIWATAAVLLRVVCQTERSWLAWGLLGFLPTVLAAIVVTGRKMPTTTAIRALLDNHGRQGGLLMADGEADIGRWQGQLQPAPWPAVRFQWPRRCAMLLAAGVFLTAAFLIPDRYLPLVGSDSLQTAAEIKKLTEKIETLKKEQIVPPEKAEVLQRGIERLQQEASGRDPAKTMEAMDNLEQQFARSAAEAAQSAMKRAETAGQVEKLAAALGKASAQLSPEQLSAAMKELGRLTSDAMAENKALEGLLSDELKEACREGNLSAEQLKQLAEALRHCKACDLDKLGKLVQARLLEVGDIKACKDCEGDLWAILGQCEGGDKIAAILDGDGLPGRGGVSRGRGDAAMTWSEGTSRENVAFKEKILMPSALSSLKQSRMVGMAAAAPTAAKPAVSAAGALHSAQAGGGGAQSQAILPEHENAVRRYFDKQR